VKGPMNPLPPIRRIFIFAVERFFFFLGDVACYVSTQ
jgi:hypothetical protein